MDHQASAYPQTPKTKLTRARERGTYDRDTVHAIIDEALVAHMAVANDTGVMNIPVSHWRIDDTLYIHGSSKNRVMMAVDNGAEACFAISLLDGVVFARSAFAHSVNYRCVVLYAHGRPVEGEEKEQALKAFIEKYARDRWEHLRPPTAQELKATKVTAFKIENVSAKIRSKPPSEDDLDYGVWAGVVPLTVRAQEAEECLAAGESRPLPDGLLPHLDH